MPLLLVDLDNTLIDRAGAFDRWARGFASERGLASSLGVASSLGFASERGLASSLGVASSLGFASERGVAAAGGGGGAADAEWLVAADRDGLESRERLAAMIGERFGLDARGEAGLLAELRGGLVRQLVPDAAVTRALRDARAAGWVPFVVTNGTVAQQERKLRRAGLDRDVAGWVISEGAGLRKPDPAIFQLAAARAGQPLDGAWMIGDSAEADISGARNAGLPGIWLHRGRAWPLATCQPTHVADSFPHAVEILLDLGGCGR